MRIEDEEDEEEQVEVEEEQGLAEGEEDFVVRELDVYLCEDAELYLLQFPLRPVFAPHPEVKSARWKNAHQVLEVNMSHPAMREPLKLCSTTVAQGANLGIGVLKNDALHITPLREVLQMRPSFKHLTPVKSTDVGGAGGAPSDEDEEEVEQRPVLQRVGLLKKKESDRAQSARVQSYSHLQAQEEGEPWMYLQTHAVDSPESDLAFGPLYYDDGSNA